MDRKVFRDELEKALAHVRDIVALRTMALGDVLLPGVAGDRRGWELSRRLLESIDELRPSQPGGAAEGVWVARRYQIMTLRYVNGLEPEAAADRLAISRRHFYRQLQRALDDLADYLWAGVADAAATPTPAPLAAAAPAAPPDERDILRQDSAKQLRGEGRAGLAEVLGSVRAVVQALPLSAQMAWTCHLDPAGDAVAMNAEILKQLLLGLVGQALSHGAVRQVDVSSHAAQEEIALTLALHAREGALPAPDDLSDKAFVYLAAVQGAQVAAASTGARLTYTLRLPAAPRRTVLIVDDNEDVCLLFRRYLANAGYWPLTATSGAAALELARAQRPYAVTLDLMMNHEDGWDVLQQLRHDPQTVGVPVIVCSVLDQRELALLLGARSFLKKPVMPEALLQALAELAQAPARPTPD